MIRIILLIACVMSAGATWSQVETSVNASMPTPQERQAEGQRLLAARQQIDTDYQKELKGCYQNFDVTSCRLQARERRIQANAALRQEELRYNASERRIQAAEAMQRTDEKNSEAKQKEMQAERAQAIQARKDKAEANAQKLIDHELQGTKRGEYEQKQRDAAQHRADLEKKVRERTKEPSAPLPVPGK